MPFSTLTYVIAQGNGDLMLDVFETVKNIGFIITVIGAVAAIVYSVFNRKKYDGLKESIEEQKGLIEIKNARIKTLTEEHKAEIAGWKLTTTEYEKENTALKRSNQILVSANLQSAAILKKLRLAGHWDGDENDVFRDAKNDVERK